VASQILNSRQAGRLRKIVSKYKPVMGLSWQDRDATQLWLRVLSQVVVAGNSAPAALLEQSKAVQQVLSYPRLKTLTSGERRRTVHKALYLIGTRYVGANPKNKKVEAAVHNFEALWRAGGPYQFFKCVASLNTTDAKIEFLMKRLKFYKKKGCRDILIELGLANDCMAIDQRIKRILEAMGVSIGDSLNRRYEEIEGELIAKVAKPRLTGGELDRILFKHAGDIIFQLRF
jgi:hypothetical protein